MSDRHGRWTLAGRGMLIYRTFTIFLIFCAAIGIGNNLLFGQPQPEQNRTAGYVSVSPDRLGELFSAVETDSQLTTGRTTHLNVDDQKPEPSVDLPFSQTLSATQNKLSALNYLDVFTTGQFDGPTKEAILRFEADNDLVPDGRIDRQMLERLEYLHTVHQATVGEPANPKRQVMKIQMELSDLGYSPGPIDGLIGKATQSAIVQFQKDRGLEPTGVIDPSLLSELVSVSRSSPSGY